MSRPLVVTPGDPAGVGPEVVARALPRVGVPAVIVGCAAALERWTGPLPRVDHVPERLAGVALLEPPPGHEPVEVASLRIAVEACRSGRARALVTGPIHKGRLARRGFAHPGHTAFLGHLLGVPDPVMAFVGRRLRVVLVTDHLPLRAVPGAITVERVVRVARLGHRALRSGLGIQAPRLVACGLNPHAGDGGVLGEEDRDVVAPACERLRAEGLDVAGPVSAEAAFRRAWEGGADLVVAMYHDQALAPLKLVEFGRAVNWTLGLPIVRTSVDHGTADDIAGRGSADPGSMEAALRLAVAVSSGGATAVQEAS